MKYCLILIILLLSFTDLSSKIIWADKVVGYSSSQNIPEYGAIQALGKPSIMSNYGISECAWMPQNRGYGNEWIRLKFPRKINIEQIIIHENIHPGAITKIFAYDSLNQGIQIYTNNFPKSLSKEGRILYLSIDRTQFTTNEIKIEVNLSKYLEAYQIDAVGIADTKSFYEITINEAQDTLVSSPENLGNKINSEHRELVPIISADDSTLFFVRYGHPENIGGPFNQDIWYSKKDSNGEFQTAENMGFPINNDKTNFIISALPDGNTLIIGNKYKLNGEIEKGISKTIKTKDGWSFPDSIHIINYYNYNALSSFSMSSSGKVFLMSLERKDSYGVQDIYVSFILDNGDWSEPRNLGPVINTAAPEITPFIASDDKTLYFSTSGKPGYGTHDMFVAKRLDDTWTNWTEPLNLGKRLNSSNWDAYYTIPASGNYAYFVSSDNSIGQEDIFRVKLQESIKPEFVVLVTGKVYDSKTNSGISAKIIYEDLSNGEEVGIANSNPETGNYSIVLPAGKKYGFLAEQDGYIAQNENLDLTSLDEYKEIRKDLYLIPIEKGQTIRINNIFFDFADFKLLNESFSEMNRLVEFLNENPEIRIGIYGYTDNIGSSDDNIKLSLARANSVAEYLTLKGIDKSRLIIKGFGMKNPIASNSSEEGRQKNRRVEFTILD